MNLHTQIITSRFLGSLTSSVFTFYVFHKVFTLTNSALWTGAVGLILYLPTITLNLYVGNLSDQWKNIGKIYHIIIFIKCLIISTILFSTHLYVILIVLLGLSIIRSFRIPTYYSMIQNITFSTSNSAKLNTIAWQLPIILAPALVTLSYSLNLSPQILLIFICLIQFSEYLLTFRFTTLQRTQPTSKLKTGIIKSLKSLNIIERKELFAPFFIDAILASFMGLTILIPFILLDIGADATKFGFTKSLFHFFAFISVLLVPKKIIAQLNLRTFSILIGIWSVALLLLGLNQSFTFLLILIAFLGLIDGLSCILREKFLLQLSKNNELGKVSALNALLIATGDELGEFNTGFWIENLGLKLTIYTAFGISLFFSIILHALSQKPKKTIVLKKFTNY